MGKTSVMRKMLAEPPVGVCAMKRSLQGINAPEEFARALVADVEENAPGVIPKPVVKRLRKSGLKKVAAKPVEVEFEPVGDEAWKDVVTATVAAVDDGVDEKVVFLWDELPHMVAAIEKRRGAATAREVLDMLRFIRETYPSIRMVLSGSLGIHHVVDRLRAEGGMWAPVDDMNAIDLPPLDGDDAAYLAVELLSNEGIECDDEAAIAAVVAAEVDHVPYYVHHTVDQLQRRQRSDGMAIDETGAQAVVEAAIVDPLDPWQLKHYVDRVPVYYGSAAGLAYAVLDAIAADAGPRALSEIQNLVAAQIAPPTDGDLHSLLELLCKDYYIEPDYRFRLELVRRAWKARRPLR
jgi:hypothetical protein